MGAMSGALDAAQQMMCTSQKHLHKENSAVCVRFKTWCSTASHVMASRDLSGLLGYAGTGRSAWTASA